MNYGLHVNNMNRIRNNKGKYYHQEKNGLYVNNGGYPFYPPEIMRLGNRFLPKREIVLAKISNRRAFFRHVNRGDKFIKNRLFGSKREAKLNRNFIPTYYMVFDPKNSKNVIGYYKLQEILPRGTMFILNGNRRLKQSKLRMGTAARIIQHRVKRRIFKRKTGGWSAAQAA